MIFRVQGQTQAIRGAVSVPGDKSIAHRAVLFSALASGVSEIRGFPDGADNHSTVAAIQALGCRVESRPDGVLCVHGAGSAALASPSAAIDCGNSGTTARLLAGLLAGCNLEAEITGDASLRARPMERVAKPLRILGANVSTTMPNGTLPLTVKPARLRAGNVSLEVASAQLKSAVLLAALGAPGRTEVREPFPSRDHSERMLMEMGAPIEFGPCFAAIEGPFPNLNPLETTIPGDPSSAAFLICLATLIPGSELKVSGLLDNPGRAGFLRVLERMGARFERQNPRVIGGEPVVDLRVTGGDLVGTEIHAEEVPACIDEIPVLAVAMSRANGPSRVCGAAELRVKEADRIQGIVAGLRALGAGIDEHEDGFSIEGAATLEGAKLHGLGDHRLVMAFAVAAAIAEGASEITSADAVAISYPDFAQTLNHLGAQISEI